MEIFSFSGGRPAGQTKNNSAGGVSCGVDPAGRTVRPRLFAFGGDNVFGGAVGLLQKRVHEGVFHLFVASHDAPCRAFRLVAIQLSSGGS